MWELIGEVVWCGKLILFSRELSFKKGDFIDLTHTVDENWLEGDFGGKLGIFPANYVKVSSYNQITMSKNSEQK